MMLKVILYAYMNNIYSCRKIEKLLRAGIALVHGDSFLKSMEFLQKAVRPAEADKEDNNL